MRRILVLLAFLASPLLVGGTAHGVRADEPVNQFRFTRQSNSASSLTLISPALPHPLQLRAGSGTVSDECAINYGWLPRGAYDVTAHDTTLDGNIAGYAWELSEHACYDGTFRTDLLIHSEMSVDGGQDETWEPHVWTYADPDDYTSFGCIKVSYVDVLALERTYEDVEGAGWPAQLLVE